MLDVTFFLKCLLTFLVASKTVKYGSTVACHICRHRNCYWWVKHSIRTVRSLVVSCGFPKLTLCDVSSSQSFSGLWVARCGPRYGHCEMSFCLCKTSDYVTRGLA